MTTPPTFSVGQTLTSSAMNAVGMWTITSSTFSAVASVSVNNCFTSSYTNYAIVLDMVPSTYAQPYLKLRVGGTDSSASYYYGGFYIDMAAASLTAEGSTNVTSGFRLGAYGPDTYGSTTFIYKPALAVKTTYTCQPQAAENYARYNAGYHNIATAYDGFTLLAGAGTLTGTLRVYGFRN